MKDNKIKEYVEGKIAAILDCEDYSINEQVANHLHDIVSYIGTIERDEECRRPNGGILFHGGCSKCINEIHTCPSCRYMNGNWDLPNKSRTKEDISLEVLEREKAYLWHNLFSGKKSKL